MLTVVSALMSVDVIMVLVKQWYKVFCLQACLDQGWLQECCPSRQAWPLKGPAQHPQPFVIPKSGSNSTVLMKTRIPGGTPLQ